jgi:ABC-type uncharacterized transport system ATPase subunit
VTAKELLSMQASSGFHRILSLEVDGGFIGPARLEFAPGLNCIIGGRGTGKTTVLEFIRYGLNAMPEGDGTRERRQAIENLIAGNSGPWGATVSVDIETKDGVAYRAQRDPEGALSVIDGDGDPKDIALPGSLFWAEVYSQNQIEDIADNPRFQLDLLDKFIRGEIAEVARQIERTRGQLRTSADDIEGTQRKLGDYHDQLRELPETNERIKAFEVAEEGPAHNELRAEQDAKALRDSQERTVAEAISALSAIRQEVSSAGASALHYAQSVDTAAVASGPNARLMTDLGQVLARLSRQIQSSLNALDAAAKAAEGEVDPLRSALRQQQASQERRYREVLDRYAQEKGKAQERARLLSRQAELQVIDKHRRDAAARLERQQRERRALMSQLVDLRDQRYQLRLAVAQRLNEQLFPVIRVRVEQCGNTDEYRSLLSDAMRNSGLRYGSLVERAVTRIPPDDLATIVRTDDVEGLVEHLGVDRDRAMKFIAQLRDHRMLHEIETVELHDRPTIELKDGEQYKDSTMLSTGQKCTAILPILLLESEAPLLIDQPEDNLDNAFVFDTIVKSVLKAKSGRQLIFVTHNPNIPVLGDAERVFVMASDGTTATVSAAGTVDDVRADIERLLEGGRDAFQRRMERYGY